MQQWGIPLTEVELADFLAGEDERGAELMMGALKIGHKEKCAAPTILSA